MNKKQAVIIATLLVLIVCAGVLATRVNDPLYVNGNDGGKSTLSLNTSDKKSSKSDFFGENRMVRDQRSAQALQNLKALMDDQNISKDSKETAAKKYTNLSTVSLNEGKIETALKSKGFEEVLCFVDDEKVRITVKGKEQLSESQNRVVKDVVMSIAKIKDVEIDVKQ